MMVISVFLGVLGFLVGSTEWTRRHDCGYADCDLHDIARARAQTMKGEKR